MALRLHAVTPTASSAGRLVAPDDTRLIEYRDLSAVVSDRERFSLDDDAPHEISRHRQLVDAVFRRQAVLPAPPGVVFRTEHVLMRWMELHYVTLDDALGFVADRNAARVHVRRVVDGEPDDVGVDLAEHAAEIFRVLRRRSVASVPLTIEQFTGIALTSGFLVEQELWREFTREIDELREAHEQKLRIDLTGPWAPYDFVRMQFGD